MPTTLTTNTIPVDGWPCSEDRPPRHALVTALTSLQPQILVLTDDGLWRLRKVSHENDRLKAQRIHRAGGRVMSVSPRGATVFSCRGDGLINALGTTTDHPFAFAYQCEYDILSIAALCDTAALVATRTAIWVMNTDDKTGQAMTRNVRMQRVAGSQLAGFRWGVPAKETIFAEVTTIAALPVSAHRWRVVGHDRFARKLFAFNLTFTPCIGEQWIASTVTCIAGDGSPHAPFGGLVRLEPTATPYIAFATTWLGTRFPDNSCQRRQARCGYAVNTITGNAVQLCEVTEPMLLTPGLYGDIIAIKTNKAILISNSRGPSAAIRFFTGFCSRFRPRACLTAAQRAAVVLLEHACSKAGIPQELQQHILSYVAIDALGRNNICPI